MRYQKADSQKLKVIAGCDAVSAYLQCFKHSPITPDCHQSIRSVQIKSSDHFSGMTWPGCLLDSHLQTSSLEDALYAFAVERLLGSALQHMHCNMMRIYTLHKLVVAQLIC